MAANEDWSSVENGQVVTAALDLVEGADRAEVRRDLLPRLDGRTSASMDYKLSNVSSVLVELGLPAVPGYMPLAHRQLSLVPEVSRQARSRGLLPADSFDYDAMCVFVGQDATANLARGIATRTWGFPKWEPIYQGQPSIGLVLLASNFSGGSPRVSPADWQTGRLNVQLCRFIGPFVEGHGPHWVDELAENAVKYPARFGIEPLKVLEDVPLEPGGPLGEVADAIRRSATHRGMGKLVVHAPKLLGTVPLVSIPSAPSPVEMTSDIPDTGQQRRRRGLGRLTDAAMRRAVELRAMHVVQQKLEGDGWTLSNTSAHHPWDFEAAKDVEVMRVEVKGTTGVGTHVILTAGEVLNATTYDNCALAVVTDIVLDTSGEEPTASGGQLRMIRPWLVTEASLRPLAYEDRLPVQDGSR